MSISQIKRGMKKKPKKARAFKPEQYLNSSSTLLNLAVSGHPQCCYKKGHYYYFVGDSTSGKTWFCLAALAEATIRQDFDNYDLIYDDIEGGALMNIKDFFGPRLAKRLLPPNGDRKNPEYSQTLEEMYYSIDDRIKTGKPFIWITDSMDALVADDDVSQFEKEKKAHRSGKDASGSYAMAKPKKNSMLLRKVTNGIKKTGSIVIFISQTRDNVGFGFEKKTRSGGRALKFYATLEMWTSVIGNIKKKIREQDRQLGVYSQVKIKKNRIKGRDRTVTIPIYHSHGIDDIGGCIDFLVKEKFWKKSAGKIYAKEFDVKLSHEALITHIETEELEPMLRSIVTKAWNEIEEACKVRRKNRYAE